MGKRDVQIRTFPLPPGSPIRDLKGIDFSESDISPLTPTSRDPLSSYHGLDPNSSPFIAPTSAQPPSSQPAQDIEDSINLEEFDLTGFTQEEVQLYNAIAEPGQRLQDAVTPRKMRESMRQVSSRLP